jgi:WD40 repeat protein/serine/threonine protein kinase
MVDTGDAVQRYWGLWEQGGRPEVGAFLAASGPLAPEQVAEICWIDQRERWRAGEPVAAERYLQLAPALAADAELALELVFGEYLQREARGAAPHLSEFERRFPQFADRLRQQVELHRTLQPPPEPTAPGPTVVELPAWAKVPALPFVPGYELLGELGQGGMSIVYQARQCGLGRLVALKMIRSGHLADAEERARFRSEAAAVAALQHPNVVQIFEIGEADGRPYLALELVAGGNLAQHLAARPQPAAWCAELVETLAGAVQHAHERGIVHRDLKPANVLLVSGGVVSGEWSKTARPQAADRVAPTTHHSPLTTHQPKVTDFGLAKHLAVEAGLTQAGTVLGTPSYMAPEQAAGKTRDVGPAADVYALGAILYECLTGRPPFLGESALETVRQVLYQEPVPPRRLQPAVPLDLDTICLKCLEKEPARRYASAAALADDLRHFLAAEPIHARPVGGPERLWRWARRKPALAAATLLAALALAAVVGLSASLAVAQTRAAEHLRREQARTQTAFEASERQRLELEEIDRSHRRTLRLSAELALDRGLALLHQGDTAAGMLWLARCLEIAPPEADDLRHAARVNLTAWRPQLHPLLWHLEHPEPVFYLALSSDGQVLATASGTGRPESASEVRLWHMKTGKLLTPPLTFPGTVRAVAISADGHTVAAAATREVRVWDGRTGRPRCTPLRVPDTVGVVAVSRDGSLVLTGTTGKQARLWDAATGKPRGPVLTHTGWLTGVAFSPDGKVLVTRGGKRLCLWDAATGALTKTLEHDDYVFCAVFSPDGKLLMTGSHDKHARLWDVPSGALRHALRHPDGVGCGVFSHDGRTLATGSTAKLARLWDVTTGQQLGPSLRHAGTVWALAFRPDDRELVTGNGDGVTCRWDVATGALLALPAPPPRQGKTNRLTSDGRHFLAIGDRSVRVWEVAAGCPLPPELPHAEEVTAAAIGPGGGELVTGTRTGEVRRWRIADGRPLGAALQQRGAVMALAFADDGRALLGAGDGRLWRWSLASGKLLGEPVLLRTECTAAAFLPGGHVLVTGHRDRTAQCWDGLTGAPRGPELASAGKVTAVAFGLGGATVLTGHATGDAHRWDAVTGQASVSFRQTGALSALGVSADGKRVATAGADGHVCLWDAATGDAVGTPVEHRADILALAFSPDGRTLATGGFDRMTRFWDVATGRPLGPPLVHDHAVRVLVFHPDGGRVLTAGQELGVRLWQLPGATTTDTGRLVQEVQQLTGLKLNAAGGVVVRR